MRRRLLFATCAVVAAALTFRAGAAMLGGTIWRFGSWENLGRGTSLWEALPHIPESRRLARSDDEFWDLQGDTLANAGGLLLVAVGVGIIVYRVGVRRARTDEPADYKETPAGAVPDGRAEPPPAG